jgi:hypothetical protein
MLDCPEPPHPAEKGRSGDPTSNIGWKWNLSLAIALVAFGLAWIDSGFLCLLPLAGIVPAIIMATWRDSIGWRLITIGLSLGVVSEFMITAVNVWSCHQAVLPIKAIGGSVFITGDGMGVFSGPAGVISITLETKNVGDAELEKVGTSFEKFRQMTRLSLRGSRVTDAGSAHLSSIKSVNEMDVSVTRIGDAGIVQLRRICPRVSSLNLDSTGISDVGLVQLRAFERLRHVRVTNTSISKRAVQELKRRMPDLEVDE